MADTQEKISSFPPVINSACSRLILGSIPGEESLRRQQYYAHPRNQFWKIVCTLLGSDVPDDYQARKALLLNNGIALWDVIETCERKGSLDSDIRKEKPNDFAGLFAQYPGIERIFFNGRKAYDTFKRTAGFSDNGIQYILLPSTSPAHTIGFDKKLALWRVVVDEETGRPTIKETGRKTMDSQKKIHRIGTFNEYSIHSQLKKEYQGPGDTVEEKVDGYYIDVLRNTGLVEIQTGNFSGIKKKLNKLLDKHTVTLVHNIPANKWIITIDDKGEIQTRRKSPKKGRPFNIFDQLIYLSDLAVHPHLTIEILITEEEEIRQDDGMGSWRRKGISIKDRRLVTIITRVKLSQAADYLTLLPEELPDPFTTKDIAALGKVRLKLAQKAVYFLRNIGAVEQVGKKGNLILYSRSASRV